MSNPQNHADAVERAKAVEAVALRRSGLTYREIAVQTGYWTDESGARHAVTRLLARQETEGVAELRAIECERLDALTAAHWPAAIGGNTEASMIVLRVIDRRAKLLGLNAPTRLQVAPDELTAAEFATRAATLITELRPDSLRQMFAGDPAAAVFNADERNGRLERQRPTEPVSSGSVAHSPEITAVAGIDADGWSNVGGAVRISTPPPAPGDNLDDVPDDVLAAAEDAAEAAAAAVIATHRRGGVL